MNEYKHKHIEKKKAIISCLKEAESFFKENELSYEAENTKTNRIKLENGEFSISVVGEFSAGKSTFLNALMGDHILPSFSAETTATINFLRHKDQATERESGLVVYKNGREKKLEDANLDTIKQYVSTDSTDENVVQSIDHLDLFLESKFLEDNVTLVDTPGLNGIAEGHKETTIKQIQQTSAGIFIFKANQPGSKSDFEFLNELRKRVDGNSIILVLNRIDEIKSSEGETVETVVNKLKENYKKIYPSATTLPEIWPVAAYPALIARSDKKFDYRGEYKIFSPEEKAEFEKLSRMKAFEDRLWKFLTQGEKTKQELLAPIRQLESTLLELKNNYNAQLESLNGTVDQNDIEKQKLELTIAIDKLNEEMDGLTSNMSTDVQNAEDDFFNEIKVEVERFKNNYLQRIKQFESIDEIDPDTIQNRINDELLSITEYAYENYGKEIRSIMARNARSITTELNDSLSSELNIKLNSELILPELKSDINKYKQKEEVMSKEIDELRKQLDDIDIDIIQASKNEDRIDSLERDLKELKARRDKIEDDALYYTPEIEKHQKREEKKTGWWIFKRTKVEIIDIEDDSKKKEFESKVAAKLQKYDKEIEELKKELISLPSSDVDLKMLKQRKINEQLAEKRAVYTVMQQEHCDELKKRYEDNLIKQRNQIEKFLSENIKKYKTENKAKFFKERNTQLEIMKDIITGSINKKIELKKQELDTIEKNFVIAVSEKNKKIATLEARNNAICELLVRAASLESDVDSIRADSIKNEEI